MLRVRRKDLASRDEQSLRRGQGHTECLEVNFQEADLVQYVLPQYPTRIQIFLRALVRGCGEALMRLLRGQIHGLVFVAKMPSVARCMNVEAQSM